MELSYAKAFPKHWGHAFWLLEPSKHPDEYFKRGVEIGDVLLLTPTGGYDYIFNACHPKDDPVNIGRVWEDFKYIELDRTRDVAEREDWQSAGACIGSASGKMFTAALKASVLTPAGSFDFGAGLGSCRSTAALLVLPDGASQSTLTNQQIFRSWMEVNLNFIFDLINGIQFGRETDTFFLVTGCDKATESIVAVSSAPDIVQAWCELSLPTVAGLSLAYQSTIHRLPVKRQTPISYSEDGSKHRHHCCFARGFTCTKRMSSFRSKTTIKVRDISKNDSWLVPEGGVTGRRTSLSSIFRLSSGSSPSSSSSSDSQMSNRSAPTSSPTSIRSNSYSPSLRDSDSDLEPSESLTDSEYFEVELNSRNITSDPWREKNIRYLFLHAEQDYAISHTDDQIEASTDLFLPTEDDSNITADTSSTEDDARELAISNEQSNVDQAGGNPSTEIISTPSHIGISVADLDEFQIRVVDEDGNELSDIPMSDGRIEPLNEISHSAPQLQPHQPTEELAPLRVQTADFAPFTPPDSPSSESAHPDSSVLPERSAFTVRRYSDKQHLQATIYRPQRSQPSYPTQLPYPFSHHSDTLPSSTTTFSYPSPSEAGPSKLLAPPEQQFLSNDPPQLDITRARDASGQPDKADHDKAHTAKIDQSSPIPGGFSPTNDTGKHELQHSSTIRECLMSRSSNRYSPYVVPGGYLPTPNPSPEYGGIKMEPHSPIPPHGQYLPPPPTINMRLDSMPLSLRSFEDDGPFHYNESVETSPHAGSALLQKDGDYPPTPNISLAELEMQPYSPVRSRVGSVAIEKAASRRRKKPGEYACNYPGCSATFTAKHNLQHHVNSHYGIRNYKCPCGRDFGTSHVLRRHQKKCSGKKKQPS